MISLRTWPWLCCIVLLLSAQQTALTHATWHAAVAHKGQQPSTHVDADGPHAPAFGSELCLYDFALSEVTGGSCGSGAQVYALDSAPAKHALRAVARLSVETVAAICRGPPELS